MKTFVSFLLAVAATFPVCGQEVKDNSTNHFDHIRLRTDTVAMAGVQKEIVYYHGSKPKIYPYNRQRIKTVAAANLIGYGAVMAGLYSTWYSKYPQTKFHFFNDNREWQQVDKVGHLYSAYIESYGSMEMWRWTGISRNKRILLGGLSGAAYQTVIETLDGFSAGWGWSWGDFAANVAGSGLLMSQEFAWDEQRISMKFSFHKKNYGAPDLNKRANELYGKSVQERFIKDYNGQTYWLSTNLKALCHTAIYRPGSILLLAMGPKVCLEEKKTLQ